MTVITNSKTIREATQAVASLLSSSEQLSSDVDVKFEARLIVCSALNINLSQYIVRELDAIDPKALTIVGDYAQQRAGGKPVAYILGSTGFWGLDIDVSPATLIPRADTETLIEWAITLPLPEQANILDLGTGTGAIALALASEFPNANVYAADLRDDAVELAQRNAKKLNLNVQIQQSDWFSSFDGQRFDLIVSNPPYVEPDSPYLEQGDLRFEPNSALIADNNGLADIEKIIDLAPSYLNSGGYLLLEHGFQQHNAIQDLLVSKGFTDVETREDLNSLPRITGGKLK